ncbi:MAG: AAA family ATPase [Comamonas testosteroni]|uniref:AAA family ATPase n=1 Tax=Comamonas testosteroni TaxID=285 RepID=UPI003D0CCCD7
MKLERIHLKNFRCFESLTVEFGKRLTVIIAENGAGKTALLDAIAIGFGRYLTKLPGIIGRTTKDSDLRVISGERRAPFMLLSWDVITSDGESLNWSSARRRDSSIHSAILRRTLNEEELSVFTRGYKSIDEYATRLVAADAEQESYFLPVIAYYGTNRAIREEVQRRRGFKKKFSRFDALAGALDPDSRFRAAFEWFNAMEDEERRQKQSKRDFDYKHPELQVVRTAIERMLTGFENPRTETRPLRFVIDRQMPGGKKRTLRVSQLSDGYRVVLGLTMDLARRMAEANAHTTISNSEMSPLDLPAIALIDEVDLHLHPVWQQRVVTDLMQTFKNTQFILTTHSPQVLSTVKRDNIRVIGHDADGNATAEPPLAMTYGEPSGDLLYSVMNVDPQPPVPEKDDLLNLTELVDQGLYDDLGAKNLMEQLKISLGEQHPQLQRLQRSIRRQRVLKT